MAFYGCDFTFDGIRASNFGLMLYDFGSYTQEDADLSVGEIAEERINRRYTPLLYGLVQNEPLEFTLVFGADPDRIDAGRFLTRQQVNDITLWLTGHQTYRHLSIDQEDMTGYRYKCMITQMKLITNGGYPWAFSCRVTCDSPFAYMLPQETVYTVNGNATPQFNNPMGYRGFYRPKLEISLSSGSSFSIRNITDGGRKMELTGIPAGCGVITADCQNQILACGGGYNLYPHFNKYFLRLLRGDNNLLITGSGTLKIICEFPVNIGA